MHYANNQRRLIETDLEKQTDWKRCEPPEPDNEFYVRLRKFLQDPHNRKLFNAIGQKHSKKNRALDLSPAIYKYYIKKFPGILSDDPSVRKERSTYVGKVSILAGNNEPECFANVIWAFLDANLLKIQEAKDLCDKYPDLAADASSLVLSYENESRKLDWEHALDDLSGVVDEFKPEIQDIQLARRLCEIANGILENAEITESDQDQFRHEFEDVVNKNKIFFDNHADYFPTRDEFIDRSTKNFAVPQWPLRLAGIKNSISDCEKVEDEITELGSLMIQSNVAKREELINKITKLHKQQESLLNGLVVEFPNLFQEISIEVLDKLEDENSESNDQTASLESSAVSDEKIESEISSSSKDENGTERSGGMNAPVASTDDDKLDESDNLQRTKSKIEIIKSQDQSTSTKYPSESKEKTEVQEPFESVKIPESAECIESVSTNLLNRLLTEGKFSLAYHVANEIKSFDANILGTLAEGAIVKPGSACSGELDEFITALASDKNWSEDEKLLLVVAIIQPLIFLKSYPDLLWQVASTVPPTPITDFVENFLRFYLPQGFTVSSNSFQSESKQSDISKKLDQLAKHAQESLDQIPEININYQPAALALQLLYQEDTNWYKLHQIVKENEINHVEEVRKLCKNLDPLSEIKNVHRLVPRCNPIEGHVKKKLVRQLNGTIELAVEWLDLIDTKNQDKPITSANQQELEHSIVAELEHILESFERNYQIKSPVQHAVCYRMQELLSILRGNIVKNTRIDEACINIPGIRLNVDMMPEGNRKSSFIESINLFVDKGFDANKLLNELMENDEFGRAARLIENEELEEEAFVRLSQRLIERKTELSHSLENLKMKIEEAFRLGQLWNSETSSEQVTADQDLNVRNRTDLLSEVSKGQDTLDSDKLSLSINVLKTSKIVSEIKPRMAKVTQTMVSKLESDQVDIRDQFPNTERGRDDKDFFNQKFTNYLNEQNFVSAFDLKERALHAVTNHQPIARTSSTELNELFLEFLKFSESYHTEIKKPPGLRKFKEAILKQQTIFGIEFGSLDNVRRNKALTVLQIWKNIETPSQVEEICTFLGFPVVSVQCQSEENNSELMHYEAELKSAGFHSPLPSFGSALESHLNIIVCKRSQQPDQILEFINGQTNISHGKAALVLLNRVLSNRYRLNWLKQCVGSKMMVLPLDTTLLMYLCGERNQLSALLEIGLPLAWAQPYITHGENVAKEMFVGRESEISDLIESDRRCIVFGGRQLGKSALLTHVRREYHNPHAEDQLFIEYLDVNDLGDPQKPEDIGKIFWQRVLEKLKMSGAVKDEKRRLKKGRRFQWSEYVSNLIESSLKSYERRRIILLLDETDKLLESDSRIDFQLIRVIRSLMVRTGRRFKVVLAGLQSVQRYHHWKNHPFAQLGSEIVISPLKPKAAEDLIIRPFRALGFQFKNVELVSRICSISNYHPGLIQIFCYRLLENLYENFSQWKNLTRFVSEEDVLRIESDPSFNRDVRDRFNWTLDLDYRYKVLTYGLVLEHQPTDARFVKEFKKLGMSWWPQVFKKMDHQAMRSVLAEMEGLGVLLKVEGIDRKYRLRSPNLLRLLGRRTSIEDELERIIEKDDLNQPNPRNFHDIISDNRKLAKFGPLTKELVGQISDTSELFSVTLIIGSPAMGLYEIPKQIVKFMNDIVNNEEIAWQEIEFPYTGGEITDHKILERLKQQFRPHKRNHRYALINLSELFAVENLGKFLNSLMTELKHTCRQKSLGKVVIILNSLWAWEWVCSGSRQQFQEQDNFTEMNLCRWSDGAISNALDRINLRTGSRAQGEEIFHVTAGIHELVSKTLRKANRKKSESVIDIANGVKSSFLGIEKYSLLEKLGIFSTEDSSRRVEVVRELFSLGEGNGDEVYINEVCFELLREKHQGFFKKHEDNLKDWLQVLDLIHPENEAENKFRVCPLTLEIMQSQDNSY